MDEMPADILEIAETQVIPRGLDGNHYRGTLKYNIALAILAERVRSLGAAKSAVHCGCTNYCDFDEAEEKIDELLDAIRTPDTQE